MLKLPKDRGESPIKIAILNNDVYLDAECWCCAGTGKPKDKSLRNFAADDGSCEVCNGSGWKLTEAGDAIISLISGYRRQWCM